MEKEEFRSYILNEVNPERLIKNLPQLSNEQINEYYNIFKNFKNSMNVISKKVKKIVIEHVDTNEIDNDSILSKLMDDSLDFIELIIDLEEIFNISIDDEEAENFKTINDIIKHINDKTEVT
jgi:acyl carrier protein